MIAEEIIGSCSKIIGYILFKTVNGAGRPVSYVNGNVVTSAGSAVVNRVATEVWLLVGSHSNVT